MALNMALMNGFYGFLDKHKKIIPQILGLFP
jgi:hypothetical protein